jgi:hypothetical protein
MAYTTLPGIVSTQNSVFYDTKINKKDLVFWSKKKATKKNLLC